MKITILCHKDFSGNMYNLAQSINKYTKHSSIMIKKEINPNLQYPTMVCLERHGFNLGEIQTMIYSSDVLILKESPKLLEDFNLEKARLRNKQIIVLLGGWGFRSYEHRLLNYKVYNKINNHVKWAVTSLDFLESNPWMGWIPPCVRIDDLRKKYNFSKMNPPLLATSPSNSGLEETRKIFQNIVFQMRKRGNSNFRFKIISNVINDVCLREKARASIFFDRIFDIYGINSQEAGTFESAVVTGSTKFVQDRLIDEFNCPFIFVDNSRMAAKEIVELLNHPKLVKKKGAECFEYVKRLHSGEESVKRLLEIIESRRRAYTLPKRFISEIIEKDSD